VAVTGAAETGVAATAPAPAQTTVAAAATAPPASSTTVAASASSGNLQTFTAGLGGALAPPVVAGGSKGFVVDGKFDASSLRAVLTSYPGSEFINLAGALGRSCDEQHNACANLANSGKGFAVSACDTQNNACHAAISS
jgi:hypothetical protein